MFSSVFSKTLYQKRWLLLWWSLGLAFMTSITVLFFPYLSQSGSLADSFQNVPKGLESLVGDAASYTTIHGYISQQIFALRIPLMTIVMAIALFVSISAGDEERGTLESLLAQPISRSRVVVHKYLAGSVILAAVHVVIFSSVWLCTIIIDRPVNVLDLGAATAGAWLIALVFGSLAFSLSLALGRKATAIGLTSGCAFFSFFITSLAPAVDKLQPAEKLSVFYYYNSPPIMEAGLSLHHGLVLGLCIGVPLVIGWYRFVRRDLRNW